MERPRRSIYQILLITILLVFWWVGIWGLTETILQQYIRGSFTRSIIAYCGLVAFVVCVVLYDTSILEHFL
jgi:succinate dehydrogenase hydrophobic anchor subunit